MNKYVFDGFEIIADGYEIVDDVYVFSNGQVVPISENFTVEDYIEKIVPTQITPRQLRLHLLTLGLLDDVEALCTTDKAMSIWFEYSLDFQRNHPMIEAMAVQLGLTQDDMDTFFIEASKL